MKLYRCPPLRAWMTAKQCQRNQAMAHAGNKSGPGNDLYLATYEYRRACSSCPGVKALARRKNAVRPRDSSDFGPTSRSAPVNPRKHKERRIGGATALSHLKRALKQAGLPTRGP